MITSNDSFTDVLSKESSDSVPSSPACLTLRLTRSLELFCRQNGSYAACFSIGCFSTVLTIFSILRLPLRKKGLFFIDFPFFPNLFPFWSLHEPCCSPTAPVCCATEAKRLPAERNTFAAAPRGDNKTDGLILGHFSLLMLLRSPVLWQPKELYFLEVERGGGRKGSEAAVWEQPCSGSRSSAGAAGVDPAQW